MGKTLVVSNTKVHFIRWSQVRKMKKTGGNTCIDKYGEEYFFVHNVEELRGRIISEIEITYNTVEELSVEAYEIYSYAITRVR